MSDGADLWIIGTHGATPPADITAGSITGVTITGTKIRTAADGQRVEMTDEYVDRVRFFTGYAGEVSPGQINSDWGGIWAELCLHSPFLTTGNNGHLTLGGSVSNGAAMLGADNAYISIDDGRSSKSSALSRPPTARASQSTQRGRLPLP